MLMNFFSSASLLACSAMLFFGANANADVITNWDFSAESGLTADGPAIGEIMASSKNANWTNTTSTGLIGASGLRFEDFNGAAAELNLRNFGTLGFTLTADPGFNLNVDDVVLSGYRNGGGAPPTWNYETSIDNGAFSTYGGTFTPAAGGAPGFETFTFTGAITGATSVEFRFAPTGNTGNIHINDIQVNGLVVSAVPEPSSLALMSLGLVGLLTRRRKC